MPGNPFYNLTSVFRISGELEVQALERALSEIVTRHEVLRTTFLEQPDGVPVQVIAAFEPRHLELVDLSDLLPSEQEAEVRRWANGEAQSPFDLSAGPLLRVKLLRLSARDHVLLLSMHHIVTDAWSTGVFHRELSVLYAAFVAGRPSPLPELPIQYADYAAWQRERLQGQPLERLLSYWKRQLDGAPPVLELLTDRPRPPIQSHRGATHVFTIPEYLSHELESLCRQERATLFMLMLAAWKILLFRYTGRNDISIGSPVAGRDRIETERLIGFFANTLVMRTDVSGDPTFRDLLSRVREVALEAYIHRDLPFERLVEELQPPRNLGRNPLFQIAFQLSQSIAGKVDLAGVDVEEIFPRDTEFAQVDLSLHLRATPSAIFGYLNYSTDLFERSMIERLAGHFQTLLRGIATNPDERITCLPIFEEAERRMLLAEWNGTAAELPREGSVHALFEAQVARSPEATALVFEGQRLTFAELNARANRLAHYLRSRGVGPEILVGLCVERSPEMVVGVLGILKAGGAYVPLDPTSPPERLAFMLEDAGVLILVTQQRLATRLLGHQAQPVFLDRDWPIIGQQPDHNSTVDASAGNLAYVIYTSGSTGKPKGTMISHRGLLNYLAWATKAYEVERGRGALVHSSIAFDLTVTSLFSPLLCGRTVTLVAEDETGIWPLCEALSEGGYSLIKLTPSHLQLLSQWLPIGAAPAATARIVVGGEALSGQGLTYWARFAPNTRIVNEYGPTEAVVGCAVHELSAKEVTPSPVPIGRPIANVDLYVLNRLMQPVPKGVPGELFIGGMGVARGYLNRPGLTAEQFVPHPFSHNPGERLYRTGDLVRSREDGNLEFLGRIDTQVKLRGYRVELGEIEAVLRKHHGVRNTVVLAREDMPGDKRLVAYVVGDDEATASASDLLSFAAAELPQYMVPDSILFIDELPLTKNGKVDRSALPAHHPGPGRPDSKETFVAPRTALEEEIARTLAAVLRLDKVGVYDDFFELGAHSLLVAELASRFSDAYGVNLPVQLFFKAPTVAGLAGLIEGSQSKNKRARASGESGDALSATSHPQSDLQDVALEHQAGE
jgi:amino acid adenylation domain-containing protein